MQLLSVARTDVGRKRKHNEDAFLADESHCLFAVADGMGGHAAGDVASQEALDSLRDQVLQHAELLLDFQASSSDQDAESVRVILERAVRFATYQVFGLTQVNPDRKGMGTTISSMLLLPQVAITAHVGDSRIYAVRQGTEVQLTQDHTFVAAMLAQGKITSEEAKNHIYSNVLVRAVGVQDHVQVDTRMIRYQPGDVFVLCSDGLHGYLRTGELARLVEPAKLHDTANRLIDLANQRGGKDNITIVLVRADGF
jgi:serine/threonine protein phosphatase PrpC